MRKNGEATSGGRGRMYERRVGNKRRNERKGESKKDDMGEG